SLAAGVEHGSRHPLAAAVMDYAAAHALTTTPVTETRELAGSGLQARIDDRTLYLGNERWMDELGLAPALALVAEATSWREQGKTVSWLAEETQGDRRLLGALAFGDAIKPQAAPAIAR